MTHQRDDSACEAVLTKQEQIAYRAKHHPREAFTALGHNLTKAWLETAYHRTRKDGAVGIDGVTSQDYAESLDKNLERLSDLARSGRYHAPPVRRGYVPKPGKTETRPIGMPSFEDKILQRAVTMILEPIYEQDFLDCSYGFRPGRSAHQALEAIWQQAQWMGGCWLLEVDIRKFFDTLDHQHLREILDPSGQDAPCRVQASGEVPEGRSGDIRFSRLHPLLGQEPRRLRYDPAQNRQGPGCKDGASSRVVVPKTPASADARAAPQPES